MDGIAYHNIDDLQESSHKLIVLYGETGKRKTTTSIEMVKELGLYISADNSWQVLKKSIHNDLRKKVKLVMYDGMSMFDYLDYTPYDTIINDTFTSIVDRYLDVLLVNSNWGGKYRDKLVSDDPAFKGLSTTAPIDYKLTRDMFRPLIVKLMELPMHKIFIMHVNDPIPGLSKDLSKHPRLPGATWQVVKEFANVIGYIEGDDRKGFTVGMDESSMAYVGKSQIEGLSGKMKLEDFIKTYKELL